MATHSSILAWRIPGTEEPGGLLSMGSYGVGHDWSDLTVAVIQLFYEMLFVILNTLGYQNNFRICFYISMEKKTHSDCDRY